MYRFEESRQQRSKLEPRTRRTESAPDACPKRILRRIPVAEGHIFEDIGKVFDGQLQFPCGVTFAPRTIFSGECIFGPGTTFGTGCEFRQSCVFGERCVFDSQARFDYPCLFQQNCVFGLNCSTAPNNYFEPGCSYIDQNRSLHLITTKEARGYNGEKLFDDPNCARCHSRKKSHVLIPCGHVAVCSKCSKRDISRAHGCPICGKKVQKVYRVHV